MSKTQLLLLPFFHKENKIPLFLSLLSLPTTFLSQSGCGSFSSPPRLLYRLVFHAKGHSGVVNRVMVSIRRRKLLALRSGQNSVLDPLSRAFEHRLTPNNWGESKKPVGVHHLHSNEETTSATDLVASVPPKENLIQKFPEVRRRKRHRRKHVENQEACTMRGVYYKNRKWQAAIKVDKKQIHLGTVSSEEEAARLYDRAAFMCGREPNFVLSEEEKQELRQYNWDEFLAITRAAITNKKGQRGDSRRKLQNDEWEGRSSFSASEDDTLAAS